MFVSSYHHCGAGPFEIGARRIPVGAVAHDDLAAARTAHRVVRPAAARGDPHHVRAVVGRRRHQHVVAVGDDDGVGVAGQPAAQCALDVVDLTDPVELVAGQVQQHDHLRVDGVGDVRHVHLVDLERRQRGVAGAPPARRPARRPCWRPRRWWRRGPSVPSAAAVIRVVVDLPLVPVTTTVRRPSPSWRRIDLSSVIATRPPIIAPAPRPVTRDAQRAAAPAASATRPRAVTIPGILGARHAASRGRALVGSPCHPDGVSHTGDECRRPSGSWGRPAAEPGEGWAVVDVETSGFRPGQARIVSVAALALGDDGNVEHSVSSLLNPGVDPGPDPCARPDRRDARGPAVLRRRRRRPGRGAARPHARRPQRGFDYSFLAAEAELAGVELPIDTVMCTVELARRLDLGADNLRLETLARIGASAR